MDFRFWPFPILRNYETSQGLTKLFIEFASSPDLQVEEINRHFIVVSCSKGLLRFWSSNAYYAWALEGVLEVSGKKMPWKNEMPSRYAVRAMRKAIDRVRFTVPSTEKETA